MIEATITTDDGYSVTEEFADWDDLSNYVKSQWPYIVSVDAHPIHTDKDENEVPDD